MVKLRSITESLNKKLLVEKYSDSMPDWLQHRLDYSQAYNRTRNSDTNNPTFPALKSDKSGKKDITGDYENDGYLSKNNTKVDTLAKKYGYDRISHTYRGGANRYDDQESSLYANFRKMGIPLDKVKVEEGPIPTKRTDERLKEPNIPIFLFSNGQVYAKGVNDSEDYLDDAQSRPFKYLPMKELLSNTVAFAYIDGNDSSNFNSNAINRERHSDTNQEWKKYERNRDKSVSDQGAIEPGFDKSGYPVPIEKWEKSNKTYLSQYMKKQLESYRQRIIETIDEYKVFQSKLMDKLKDTDIQNYSRWHNDGYANIDVVSARSQQFMHIALMEAKDLYSQALMYAEANNETSFNSTCKELGENIDILLDKMQSSGIMPKKLATIDWI